MGLYQFAILRRVPEPPLPFLDADAMDASGEAYQQLKTPDAALGLASAAVTLVLAGWGPATGPAQLRGYPWRSPPSAADAAGDLYLLAEQITQHGKICSWCTAAAAAQVATLPAAVPEARAALRSLLVRS